MQLSTALAFLLFLLEFPIAATAKHIDLELFVPAEIRTRKTTKISTVSITAQIQWTYGLTTSQ